MEFEEQPTKTKNGGTEYDKERISEKVQGADGGGKSRSYGALAGRIQLRYHDGDAGICGTAPFVDAGGVKT